MPHKIRNGKLCCSIKIADTSSPMAADGTVETSTLVMFGKKFADLPKCHRIGDVIRVHRANVGMYKGVK